MATNPAQLVRTRSRHPAFGLIILLAAAVLLFPGSVSLEAADAETVNVGGGVISVDFAEPPPAEFRPLLLHWIAESARAVATYYGRFPVSKVTLQVRLHAGNEVKSGQTFGWQGSLIKISAGRTSSAADLAEDWMLTHEMVHLGFPTVPEVNHWIEEGSATYVEPVARARAGLLSAERVWGDMVEGMPQGLPKAGDRGLDQTHTWGRTYWGGAIFCLLADVEIRKRTSNRKGLESALQGIVAGGGTIKAQWSITRAFETGDRATGVPVLRELYEKMKGDPYPVNLDALWKELGVERRPGGIRFNDAAPLAPIRRAITGVAGTGDAVAPPLATGRKK